MDSKAVSLSPTKSCKFESYILKGSSVVSVGEIPA